MKTSDILRKAKAHISEPDMWHKGAYSDSDDGDEGESGAIAGQPCCAVGALIFVVGREVPSLVDHLRAALPEGKKHYYVAAFNDAPDTTHADIMALFDRAIAAAEATG